MGASSAEPEVEEILLQFAALIPGLAQQHEWLGALRTRGTESSGRALLRLLEDGAFDGRGHTDTEALGSYLAQLARSYPDFRTEMVGLLDRLDQCPAAAVLERATLMLSDTESILSLVRRCARTGQSGAGLYMSIRNITVDERPSAKFGGALVMFPVPADDLRRRLFSLALTQTSEAAVAMQCLVLIDEIRDDYGYPESETRHPDIRSGQPWPLLALATEALHGA